MPQREHEIERDQTHSYWYIPSASRVNYSLLVMESAGMMKIATSEGYLSGSVLEQGPDWFLVATEACGGGTPDLFCSPMVLGYMEIYRRKESVRGATRGPRGWMARPGGGRAPLPRALLVDPLTCTPSLPGCFPSKNNFSRRFHSVSTPFDIPFLRNPKIGKIRDRKSVV